MKKFAKILFIGIMLLIILVCCLSVLSLALPFFGVEIDALNRIFAKNSSEGDQVIAVILGVTTGLIWLYFGFIAGFVRIKN